MSHPASLLSGLDETAQGPVSVPFLTSLEFTSSQLSALVEHCTGRIREISQEMGRGNPYTSTGWMGNREKWLRQYRNDWDYRRAEDKGVFEHSNYSINFAKRVCVQLTARTNREFFGTEPYFAITPEGAEDIELADRLNRYAQWKFSKSNTKSMLREAVKYAYILGERVMKVSHIQKIKRGTTEARVLVDSLGNIVRTSDGHYILEEDWIEQKGKWLCAHDLAVERPAHAFYEWRTVERAITEYKGVHLSGVHFKDFLCPLNVGDIHEADFICHLYDQPLWRVAQTYRRLDLLASQENASPLAWLIDEPKSALAQALEWRGENTTRASDAIVQIAECYLKYDVDGDGLPEDICVILALPSDLSRLAEPIYYDYCANILPRGRWPFEVVRRNPDEGRWYGVGIFEEFSHKQDFIDLHFNRINFRNMTSGTVKFWKNRDVEEEKESFTIGDNKIWTPKENADPEKIFTAVPLLEPTESAENVTQYMMQSFQLESGVSSDAEGQMSNLPSNETATGVLSNERVADELTHTQICDLEEGLSQIISAAVAMNFYHMDSLETYEYLEGDTLRLEEMTREEAENLSMNVRLLLTRRRNRQTLESNSQAIQILKTYVELLEKTSKLHLSEEIVRQARPLFVHALKSLEIQDAEKIFAEPKKV
ncbi:MAG: portal protein [Verrucomicrobiota bacterium]